MRASIITAAAFGMAGLIAGALTDGPSSAAAPETPEETVLDLCSGTAEVAEWLAREQGQRPVGGGLEDASGYLVDLYRSDADGSWTIVSTSPNQITCMIARGESWEFYTRGEGS